MVAVTVEIVLAGLGVDRPADAQEGRVDPAHDGGPLPILPAEPLVLRPDGLVPAAEDEPATVVCPGALPEFPGAALEWPGAFPEFPGDEASPFDRPDPDPAQGGGPCPGCVPAAWLADEELPEDAPGRLLDPGP